MELERIITEKNTSSVVKDLLLKSSYSNHMKEALNNTIIADKYI